MNSNEFQTIGLYNHNAESYRQVKTSFEDGNDVVGIVHATGTGKSYNALQLAYDNKDKKIVYVVPSNGIIEHITKIIDDNPNLDFKRDFPNLEFRTYQSFISLNEKEMKGIDCDLLILDEFHHIGSPVWGARINTMIETHPNMKIFGMTAYTVRDRGTSYERDMANPYTEELFSNNIESRYDLCDAMIDGVLPKPIYKSAYTNLIGIESKLEEKVQGLDATSKEYQQYMSILNDVKKRIHEAPSIPNILKKSIKPKGKYIYFCPPCIEDGANDIETIKKRAMEWFKSFVPEEDMIFYTSTSEMGEDGRNNRNAFYDDVNLDGEKVNKKLRIMFAINQYNEGIHAPNIDGVIMGRGTSSDIIYFEQLGRALSVRGNTKDMFEELERYSIEELIQICQERDMPIKENSAKENLIEKLIAPVVIDLTNNYEFIKELENNLKDRIKMLQTNGLGAKKEAKISDASFDIEIENQDLFEMLKYVSDRLTMTWEDYYELAKRYYEHHGNLEIPQRFKTTNGYEFDENGVKLGAWVSKQRINYDNLLFGQKQLLESIGFIKNILDENWTRNYKLAKAYYEKNGSLNIPQRFKTTNGYEFDEKGFKLGFWIVKQRIKFDNLSEEKKEKLEQIGFILSASDDQWYKMYELAKIYYEHHGNLEIPTKFNTTNGYEFDENGVKLGYWVASQRIRYNNSSEKRKEKLEQIGFVLNVFDDQWHKMYELAKVYYEHHGNLEIPKKFKTTNGYEFDEDGVPLGVWITSQRNKYNNLSEKRKEKLEQIGFVFNAFDDQWYKMYELVKVYCEHYGNLKIPRKFKTTNGYEFDEKGFKLGSWISVQKQRTTPESERRRLLLQIGWTESIKKNKEKIANICIQYDLDITKNKSVLSHISLQELQSKIEFLKAHDIPIIDGNELLHEIFSMSDKSMKEKYGVSLEELINGFFAGAKNIYDKSTDNILNQKVFEELTDNIEEKKMI